ncbi:hypothetical protein AJ78_07870 [Emergomyces pasteurianus Ep9510]|uniref:Uncharacterized protein n=1 Tax=Emergomyces pasteurianus Ep9510 TaxID=1447872 RepID=A0A1J9Q829_9EURO|nr:hypothetical protein AJ78_07870 [Emergomyces pasteurianus Ep9510]
MELNKTPPPEEAGTPSPKTSVEASKNAMASRNLMKMRQKRITRLQVLNTVQYGGRKALGQYRRDGRSVAY